MLKGEIKLRQKFLMGYTKDGEFAFADCVVRNNGEFSCSFDLVIPFNLANTDLEYYAEEILEYLDDDYQKSLCDRFSCKKSELVQAVVNNTPITELIDCSLYPESYTINGDDWYFESSSCGQVDLTDYMEDYTDKEACDKLIDFWKNHHLTIIDDSQESELNDILFKLVSIDEEQWIINYIQSHLL